MSDDAGMLVTYSNLRQICDECIETIGKERFERILETFRPELTRGLPAYSLALAQAHPMAVEWRELIQAVEKSEKYKKLMLPERSYFLLDLMIRLRPLVNLPRIDRILRRLETSSEYYSAIFEILILSLYLQKGVPIEVVAESNLAGERRADFVARYSSKEVFIECKSLEDRSRKEERIWRQVQDQLIKLLSTYNRIWQISITARRHIEGNDIASLVSLASAKVGLGDLGEFSTADNDFALSFQASDSTWQPGAIETIETKAKLGRAEGENWTAPSGATFHRILMMVQCEPFYSPDETKRILDDIQDAHGQIPHGTCGVVHIEIPFRDSARLLDVADLAFHRVFGFLKHRRRLNATVLSARTLLKRAKEGQNPIFDYPVIIPNGSAINTLPDEFSIFGSNEAMPPNYRKPPILDTIRWWIKTIRFILFNKLHAWPKNITNSSDIARIGNLGEGSVLIEFGIYQPLPEQLGRSILDICSRDGAHQIRLWQSFKNHFRADIVHTRFGRRTFRGDLNDLTVSALHKLGISWSLDGISVAVDGKMLEQISEP